MKTSIPVAVLLLAATLLPRAAYAEPAPDFKIAKVLNAPVKKIGGLKDLKGKVVFLDFWATWCAPCVASLPHMNKLNEALKGEPVVFIAITDESEEKLGPFLKTHEIRSWLGIDELEVSLKAFSVRSRPDGYLIGKDGTLLARISPQFLTEQDLRSAMAGKFTPRPVKWAGEKAAAPRAEEGKTIFEIKITSASGDWSMSRSKDELIIEGMPFAKSIAYIWDAEAGQVIADAPPVKSFNVTVRAPAGSFGRAMELLKTAVQAAYDMRVTPERQETDVYTLTLSTAEGAARPQPAAPGTPARLMASGGGRLMGNIDMARLAREAWNIFDKPVVDETGLAGVYAFDLQWPSRDKAAAEKLFAEQGLLLVPARRQVEFLRVTAAQP
ncbi:MAG TPA: TIGR03435 family protein [Elusimicrobiales bacterium]|nr:TIGR03435 family protein [Elusimicrobiales bacterium]